MYSLITVGSQAPPYYLLVCCVDAAEAFVCVAEILSFQWPE